LTELLEWELNTKEHLEKEKQKEEARRVRELEQAALAEKRRVELEAAALGAAALEGIDSAPKPAKPESKRDSLSDLEKNLLRLDGEDDFDEDAPKDTPSEPPGSVARRPALLADLTAKIMPIPAQEEPPKREPVQRAPPKPKGKSLFDGWEEQGELGKLSHPRMILPDAAATLAQNDLGDLLSDLVQSQTTPQSQAHAPQAQPQEPSQHIDGDFFEATMGRVRLACH
jgi:hypothetical protein